MGGTCSKYWDDNWVQIFNEKVQGKVTDYLRINITLNLSTEIMNGSVYLTYISLQNCTQPITGS
jgi:hypothetical protein